MNRPVDVAFSIYGKPFQTAVALATLAGHSEAHINRIFLQEELDQPHGSDIGKVLAGFPALRFVHYRPEQYLGWTGHDRNRLGEASYRRSIRYQFAWEETDRDYLFIAHNDCVFTGDIIGKMLQRLEQTAATGVGLIGQCWNCPASMAGVCHSDIQSTYAPSFSDVAALLERFPHTRTQIWMIDPARPAPLPECRLSEFACMVNLRQCRSEIMPAGPVVPFGFMTLDIGVEWFRELITRGHQFVNSRADFDHSPFGLIGSGHAADLDHNEYEYAEARAAEYLRQHFPAVIQRMDATDAAHASPAAM